MLTANKFGTHWVFWCHVRTKQEIGILKESTVFGGCDKSLIYVHLYTKVINRIWLYCGIC